MVSYCSAAQDLLFFADGKIWRTHRTGKCKSENEIRREVGYHDANLVQKAHCNSRCRCHGLKVSSVLQAEGMRHTHAESSR